MHHVDILHAIGNTPLVELPHLCDRPEIRLFAKLEGRNPTGSVKDRIVREMVFEAERTGRLQPGGRIIEASTGNTGIALAMVGRALGYHVRIVIPENVFPEIPRTLAAYGAEITWVPSELGVTRAIELARQIADAEGWFMLDQFADPVNIRAHYTGTGQEILDDLPHVDLFVAGLGTGGTLMGVGALLKEANPAAKVFAVEPHPGYQVQGLKSLADGFVPPLLDYSLLDGKILVRSGHAFRGAAMLMQQEAIFGGVSSGAVLHGALKAIERLPRGNVVLLFADSGWKYLTTEMWTRSPAEHEEEGLDDVIWW
ncbi:MAG TPA: cysteine synthase family protein [Dehalococcoidia bacterium]|nr:cysteine synthase family protein [Dehalococcoidia bacterium]